MNAFKGVGIQHKKSGKIYSADGWDSRGFDPDEARGIAVGDGIHSLYLYKNIKDNLYWSSYTLSLIPEVYTTNCNEKVKRDFSGKENTDAVLEMILKASEAKLLFDAPAFQWVRETYGPEAYLPAAGELIMIVDNKDEISFCSDLIGGNLYKIFNDTKCRIWSSTQHSACNAWYWDTCFNGLTFDNKSEDFHHYALAVTAL